jgi:hypothetical protein
MALTKVRLPVADIGAISDGTTDITILSTGGDIDMNVAGVNVLDLTSTDVTIGTGLTLVTETITGETVNLATAAGASATLRTTLSQAELETTSAHPLVLGANSTDGLTIGTDGRVSLGVVGSLAGQLINKDYVDTAVAALPGNSDFVFSATTPGSLRIPTDGANDFILNWGITAFLSEAKETVTFDTAYPNAMLGGMATRITGNSSRQDAAHVNPLSTTQMEVLQTGGNSSQVFWFAYGY